MSRLLTSLLSLALCTLPAACGGDGNRTTEIAQKKKSKKKKKKKRSKRSKNKKKKRSGADANYRKAIDAEADGDVRAAVKYFKRAIEEEPSHLKANQHYVHFLISEGENVKALRAASAFHEEVSGEAISYHILADAELTNKEYERVIGTITALLAFSDDDAVAYDKRGRARIVVGELEGGITDIKRALKIDPDNPAFLLSLATGQLRKGRSKAAKKILLTVLKIDDESSRARLLLGIIARSNGQLQEAKKYHQAAAELSPLNPRTQYELGITLNVLGDNEDAELHFEKAVDLAPDNSTYWYGYGELFRVTGRMDDAAEAYKECVKLQSTNSLAWEKLGEALLATKDLSGAAKYLKRGLAKVDNPRLYFLLGVVYFNAKKGMRATESFENYLDAAGARAKDSKEARRYLKRLR